MLLTDTVAAPCLVLQNASWLLLGHASLFLLAVSVVSFLVYRAMPDPLDPALV